MGNIVNRVFDSSGPEGKVRGTPQQIIEKYNQLARDAQLSNDRVAAENFQQHAEHYTRMLGEAMREQEAQRQSQERPGERPQGWEDRGGDRDDRGGDRDDRGGDRDDRGGDQGYREPRRDGEGRGDQPRAEERQSPEPRREDDVIDTVGEDTGGLVETPEAAQDAPPAKPRRPRRPRKSSSGEDQEPKPEAAE
jgi:hypothetical protein